MSGVPASCVRWDESPTSRPEKLRAVEHVDSRLPRTHVEKQAARLQLVAGAGIDVCTQLIVQLPLSVVQRIEGDAQPALALMVGVVDGDQPQFLPRPVPRERNETIVGPVAFPGRTAFQ